MRKIGLLFPGQGTQYVGMCKNLYDNSEKVRAIFEKANEVLGYDLMDLIVNDPDKLNLTEYAQPAIFVYSYAVYETLCIENQVLPYFMAGHSLGEITALTCTGAISFEDAILLVKERGKLMQEATPDNFGGMASINGINAAFVEDECNNASQDGDVIIANYNSNKQVSISGKKELVEQVSDYLTKLGAVSIKLKVSAPFHTKYMQPANDKFEECLKKIHINDLKYPVISNIDAEPYLGADNVIDKLGKQMISQVKWSQTIEYLLRQGVNTFIEIGPKSVLRSLVQKDYSHVEAYAYDKDYNKIIEILNEKKEEEKLSVVSRCLAIAVCTRNRNFDELEYQQGVIEPYRKIQKINNQIEEEKREETEDEMKQAVDMLVSVFKTKQVPVEEQKERFTQIFYESGKREFFADFELKY